MVDFGTFTKEGANRVWNSLSGAEKDTLLQLTKVTWDGNLASKTGRDDLVEKGMATRFNGYQVITAKGMSVLGHLGKLEEFTR